VLNRVDLVLLSFLTLFWGINWPVMKYAITDYPPLTFRLLCMALGIGALAAYMAVRKESFVVPLQERKRIFQLGLGNMVIWHVFAIIAMTYLTSGRAAIIGYTMPVWALIASALFFKDKITLRGGLGVLLALIATVLLTIEEFTSLVGQPLGLAMMLVAAIAWGIGTAMMKNMTVSISNACLTFWMMTLTVSVLVVLAIVFESGQWKMPRPGEWAAILFNAVVIFGFCHVVWFRLARKLPPVASSLSIMLIPILGVFSGAWALDETIGPYDLGALILILLSMGAVLLKQRPRANQ
jgi:drug/metabolite transporter (DMT)-like permease